MNKYQKLLAFYRALVTMFEKNPEDTEEYDLDSLHETIKLWKRVSSYCSVQKNTADTVGNAKSTIDGRYAGDFTYDLVESAWRDLAPHLRDPKARTVFEDLLKQLGFDESHLFVMERGPRLLADSDDGAAVVTLVTNNHSALMDLLSKRVEDATVREVHLVSAK